MQLTVNAKEDFFGGLTAAVTALPLAIAFGVLALSPLGPEYASVGALAGLYGAIFTGIFAALFGGTACQVSGPTGPMTTVLTTFVASLVALEIEVELLLVLTFMMVTMGGCVQLLFGALKVGGLIKFIPYPVIAGFMNGIAVIIFLGQVRPFLGLPSLTAWTDVLRLQGLQPWTLLVGLVTVVAVVVTPRLTKKVPGSLSGLALGTVCYYLLSGRELGPVIGEIPTGIPTPHRLLDFAALVGSGEVVAWLPTLVPAAFALGVLGSIDSLLTSVVADTVTRTRHDSNRELFGQGIGNIISGCFGGLAGAGATVRTLVNVAAGGRGRLSGMVHGLVLLAVLLAFGGLAGKIPKVVLAGILLVTAVGMVDRWSSRLIWKLTGTAEQKREIAINLAVVVVVTVVTVAVDLMVAVAIGIVIASFLFVEKMSKDVVHRSFRADVMHSRRVLPPHTMQVLSEQGNNTLVFELQGPLFFGTADRLATALTDTVNDSIERVILDFRRVREIDASGARVLILIQELLSDQGKRLALASLDEARNEWGFLVDMRVVETVGREFIFGDLDQALEWAENLILDQTEVDDHDYGPHRLEQLEILARFQPDEIETLKGYLVAEEFTQGQTVIERGHQGDSLYILTEGSLSVHREQRRVATYGPGSLVGEMAVLEGLERGADVKADRPARAYRLDRARLEELTATHPGIAAKFLWNIGAELSARLRWTAREIECLEA
ncbi:MAG: SLC26A/SulP transporter family protein [Vulcanimicrobiota bacterium]